MIYYCFTFTINSIKGKVQERTQYFAVCLPIIGLHKLEISTSFGELVYQVQHHKTKKSQSPVV